MPLATFWSDNFHDSNQPSRTRKQACSSFLFYGGIARSFQRVSHNDFCGQDIVMAFLPRNIVGCFLKKRLTKGRPCFIYFWLLTGSLSYAYHVTVNSCVHDLVDGKLREFIMTIYTAKHSRGFERRKMPA